MERTLKTIYTIQPSANKKKNRNEKKEFFIFTRLTKTCAHIGMLCIQTHDENSISIYLFSFFYSFFILYCTSQSRYVSRFSLFTHLWLDQPLECLQVAKLKKIFERNFRYRVVNAEMTGNLIIIYIFNIGSYKTIRSYI